MAEAATVWLALLDDDQRSAARWAGPDDATSEAERRRWFYTPTDHGGLTLHEQRPAQQQAVMRLLATGLSEAGFVTVATIIGLENVLDRLERFTMRAGRERGRDPGLYYLRVFGEPGDTGCWGWRFGGHHVSLNNLVVDGMVVSVTPSFLGANPATAPLLAGEVLRPLARAEDLARELVLSLPSDLRHQAVLLAQAPEDLVTFNRSTITDPARLRPHPGIWRDSISVEEERARGRSLADVDGRVEYTPTPKGVAGVDLDHGQRALLLGVLGAYFDRVPEGVSPRADYDESALDHVHFAWAGSLEAGARHYYRLQGPRLLVEWDNTQDGANHAHAVWRDPEGDFGLDTLAHHLELER